MDGHANAAAYWLFQAKTRPRSAEASLKAAYSEADSWSHWEEVYAWAYRWFNT